MHGVALPEGGTGLRSEITGIKSAGRLGIGDCRDGVFVGSGLRHAIPADSDRRCQPIGSARVEVWVVRREDLIARGATDSRGQVFVAPLTHKAYRFGPCDTCPPAGRITVAANGYLPVEAAVSSGAGRTPTIALVPAT
jgi:hypothetical protein